jgi:hypothetical protein
MVEHQDFYQIKKYRVFKKFKKRILIRNKKNLILIKFNVLKMIYLQILIILKIILIFNNIKTVVTAIYKYIKTKVKILIHNKMTIRMTQKQTNFLKYQIAIK